MANVNTIQNSIKEQEIFATDKKSLADKNLHLSVEIREHTILACLLDKDSNEYVGWAAYKRRDEKLSGMTNSAVNINLPLTTILKEEMLNLRCSGSSIMFVHNSAMLIPAAYFSNDLLKDYLKQQNLIKPGERPCADFIKNNDCYSIYAVDLNDYHLLKEKYPHAAFRHHSSIFVEYLLALHKTSDKTQVHVYVFENYMDVVALQAGKLLLYNRYAIQTANDFTYFLLWVYEELKFAPDSPCTFYGVITEKSEQYELAKKYLPHISLAQKTPHFTFAHALESLPIHDYYSLFMQYLCI